MVSAIDYEYQVFYQRYSSLICPGAIARVKRSTYVCLFVGYLSNA